MYTVEVRTYTGSDPRTDPPHTFMVVTGPDGVEHGYGFAPNETVYY